VRRLLATLLLAGGIAGPADAANGLVAPGNGSVQMGMAGAGTAMASDAAATLRNPAAGAWLGTGLVADLALAVPDGSYRAGEVAEDSALGIFGYKPGRNTSISGVFPLPVFAYNHRYSDRVAYGLGVTASGLQTMLRGGNVVLARGLPTFEAHCAGDYGGGGAMPGTTDVQGFCGNREAAAGVELAQLLISAHWAYRVTPALSLGIAPVVAGQSLAMHGVGAFSAFSNTPDAVTDNGASYSWGGGLRAGLLWQITDGIGVGVAYQSRLRQTRLDEYRGVFIGGRLDFAPSLDVGLAIQMRPGHRLLLDVEHIAYGDIRSLHQGIDLQAFTDSCFVPRVLTNTLPEPPPSDACLGGSAGPGFGWNDVTIYKLGYEGRSGRLSWRAGYSLGGNPSTRETVLANTFAPAVTDQHATVGLSWQFSPRIRIDWALVYGIRNIVRAPNAISAVTPTESESSPVSFAADADPDDQQVENRFSFWQTQFGLSWSSGR
jgi:long-chain fatty acid transport protein